MTKLELQKEIKGLFEEFCPDDKYDKLEKWVGRRDFEGLTLTQLGKIKIRLQMIKCKTTPSDDFIKKDEEEGTKDMSALLPDIKLHFTPSENSDPCPQSPIKHPTTPPLPAKPLDNHLNPSGVALAKLIPHKETLPVPTTTTKTDIQPKQEFRNEFDISKLLATAGTLQATKEQEKILFADVDEESVEIRADGLIYLPWMEYTTRLRKAFGMNWAIIPQGMPKIQGTAVCWGFHLVIKGVLMGFAIGEQEYRPNNRRMTWTDACEGAKSNCLMRLCKGIGITLELWKPSFVRQWKEKYAESYEGKDWQGKLKTLWRRKAGK